MKSFQILGAGPAGLSAAITLAKAGYPVHIHERYDVVGKRFQGDLQGLENWSTSSNILQDLKNIGIDVNFDATPFQTVTFTDGRSSFSKHTHEPLFYLVKRGPMSGSLDTGLQEQAKNLGVTFHYRSQLATKDADIIATGPLRKSSTTIDKGLIFPTDLPDMAVGIFHDDYAYLGYSYLLVAQGYGCLCSVVFRDFHRLNECFNKTVAYAQKHYLINLDQATAVGGTGGFSLHHPKQIGKSLLVGEAAGLQDLLWGFGIRSALFSGHCAVQALLHQKDYTKLIDNSLTPYLKASIVNRFLWEKIKFRSSPLGPYLLRLPFCVRNDFKHLYRFSFFHRLVYPIALRYIQKKYPYSVEKIEESTNGLQN
ncbi:MAG: NAD(P)-binding protein [Parachlamydiaceae bacterium]|nr:NAD(P)-binding protein [Parachlamydiaceae bacterium]